MFRHVLRMDGIIGKNARGRYISQEGRFTMNLLFIDTDKAVEQEHRRDHI
jgi:hypothetical protein